MGGLQSGVAQERASKRAKAKERINAEQEAKTPLDPLLVGAARCFLVALVAVQLPSLSTVVDHSKGLVGVWLIHCGERGAAGHRDVESKKRCVL